MTWLIFDCDGILVDFELLHGKVESEIGKELFGIARDYQEHNRLFVGLGMKAVYKAWGEAIGRPLPSGIENEVARRKDQAFSTQTTAIPHIADALAELAHFPCCVASGSPLPTLETILGVTNLLYWVTPNIFSSDQVKRGKPALDIFLYAAEKMEANPANCIVIDDSIHDVNAALAAGMKVIGFMGGSHCALDHAKKLIGTNPIIQDMRELPAAIKAMLE